MVIVLTIWLESFCAPEEVKVFFRLFRCSPPDIVFKYYSMMTTDDWSCLTDHEYEKGNFERWPAWCMNSGINLRTIYQKPVPQKEDTQGASISTKYDWLLNKCHMYYIIWSNNMQLDVMWKVQLTAGWWRQDEERAEFNPCHKNYRLS